MISNLKLTDKLVPGGHFFLKEVVRSQLATRLGIDNTPTDKYIIDNAAALAANVLEPLRETFGPIVPNSWYRSEKLERILCEKAYKAWCKKHGLPVNDETWVSYFRRKSHPKGEAVDIEIAGISNDQLFQWIKSSGLEYDQLIREFPKDNEPYSGWVHISYSRLGKNRMMDFVIK